MPQSAPFYGFSETSTAILNSICRFSMRFFSLTFLMRSCCFGNSLNEFKVKSSTIKKAQGGICRKNKLQTIGLIEK